MHVLIRHPTTPAEPLTSEKDFHQSLRKVLWKEKLLPSGTDFGACRSSFSNELQASPRIEYRDRSYSQGTSHRDQAASSVNARSARKLNVIRKPAPSPVGMDISERTGTPSGTGVSDECDAPNTLGFGSSGASVKSTGSSFNLSNLVKEKMTGRRRRSPIYGLPEAPDLPGLDTDDVTPTIRPMGLNSIDDWLDSREGLHKRSNTSSSSSIYATESRELHIRQSTFAPLHSPEINSEAPIPSIPSRFMAKSTLALPPRQSSLQQHDTMPRPSRHRMNRPPSPQIIPEKKTQEPRDHISQLEYEQEQLEDQKKNLRKKIYDLEVEIPMSSRSVRDQLKAQLEELNQQYADTEKSAHDLGLKLYRAYRRKDKRDGNEGPTHLWVSRVTAPLGD